MTIPTSYFEVDSIPVPLEFRELIINPFERSYSQFGTGYDYHPELTRSGARVLLSRAVTPMLAMDALFLGTYAITQSFQKVVDRAPEAEQRGLWQMFAAGLTGGYSPGSIKI